MREEAAAKAEAGIQEVEKERAEAQAEKKAAALAQEAAAKAAEEASTLIRSARRQQEACEQALKVSPPLLARVHTLSPT